MKMGPVCTIIVPLHCRQVHLHVNTEFRIFPVFCCAGHCQLDQWMNRNSLYYYPWFNILVIVQDHFEHWKN